MGETLNPFPVDAGADHAGFLAKSPITPEETPVEPETPIRRYDFAHPVPLRPAQLDSVRFASISAVPSLKSGLEGFLRTPVIVTFLDVEQSTFRDYLMTSENPTCLAAFESAENSARWLLEMTRTLAFTIIDCAFGGSPQATGPTPSRHFTNVETRVIEKALTTILSELASDLLQTRSLEMNSLYSEGTLLSEVTSNEAVALVSFEISCGACQGLLQLCIPWKDIATSSLLVRIAERSPDERLRAAALKVPVFATAQIARLKLSARELADLCPGDVLMTDADAGSEFCLEIDGHEIFRGTAGQSRNHRVLLLTTPPRPVGESRQNRE